MESGKTKPKAIIAGGSIAGISCAHALVAVGWDVVVLEKTISPPDGSPTGAGVGVDPLTTKIIASWLPDPQLLHNINLPMYIDQNHAVDGETEKKISRILTRDENFNFTASHWTDIYTLLYNTLPPGIVLWGHFVLSFTVSEDKTHVKIKCKVLQTGDIIEVVGDLLVAADGCHSAIRKNFYPDLKLRYAGYTSWRGVLDFNDNEHLEAVITDLKKVYPDLGKCLYFDLGTKTHNVLYELPRKRMNWIWYINRPEPALEGNSVTIKVNNDMIEKMHEAAKGVWVPEFARLIKETKNPFLNVIYDCDPLERIVWDRVALVGDAAHPTTPHCVRSTNMSVLDVAVLAKCLEKWGAGNLNSALEEYQSTRLPVNAAQVLHSRELGRIKQGLDLFDGLTFDPLTATPEECEMLKERNVPFFSDVPSVLG